jgi:restriction system protein
MHHEKADRGAVITTGTFTAQAKDWAIGKPISLIDGDKFLELVKRVQANASKKATN